MPYYYDIADVWMKEHPYQTFFLAIKVDRNWSRYGIYSSFGEKGQREAAMLSLRPNSNYCYILPFVIFILIAMFISWCSHFCILSFERLLIISFIFCLCHLTYMYYFTRLPIICSEKNKFTVSKLLCIVGLFITTSLVYYNYVNRENFNNFVKENNFEKFSSEEELLKMFLHIKNEKKKIIEIVIKKC